MASSYAIVAIPSVDDHVWKVSSEKVPHLTLLFLGDKLANPERSAEFLGHVAESSMHSFSLSVDHRGTLGSENADVLYFDLEHGVKDLLNVRSYLLNNTDIANAYNSTQQYPTWTPHLTLGYPATPAKKDDRDYGINWVNFDRVAIWTDDYEGPEFQLRNKNALVEVSMSTVRNQGVSFDDFLAHFGIKGMKWGVRRSSQGLSGGGGETTVVKKANGQIKKVTGGKGAAASDDAVRVVSIKQKAKKSGSQALSTKELQDLVTRMNLEQQYSQLRSKEPSKFSKGQSAIKQVLGVAKTGQEIFSLVNSPAGKAATSLGSKLIKDALKEAE